MVNLPLTSEDFILLKPEDFLNANSNFTTIAAIDTETNGKDVRTNEGFVIGISVAVPGYKSYFPVAHYEDNISDITKKTLLDWISCLEVMVFHNAKFDLDALRTKTVGLDLRNRRWYCTMMLAHILNENLPSKRLDYLSKRIGRSGKYKDPMWEFALQTFGWSPKLPVELTEKYAADDSEETLRLFYEEYPAFRKWGFDGDNPSAL